MGLFTPARKYGAKARVLIQGPAGSGKTWTALTFLTALTGHFAYIDTEFGSASKYADRFKFDVVELSHFKPDNYIRAIKAAENRRL